MRNLLAAVVCTSGVTVSTLAWAQEPGESTPDVAAETSESSAAAPATPTPPATTPPPPEPAPIPTTVTPAPDATAQTSVPPAAPTPPEEEGGVKIPGWFRIDHDSLNLQLWFGATFPLGPVRIATDVYMDSADFGEFDIGPELSFDLGGENSLVLIPMAGIGFNWTQQRASLLNAPQLFTYLNVGPIYFESWIMTLLASPFEDGADDSLYTRDFVLYNISDVIGIGPQLEATIALNNTDGDEGRNTLESLPVGGHVNLNYGENNTLGLFLGYETQEDARQLETGSEVDPDTGDLIPSYSERAVVGRIDFTRTW